jgi:hypothetical protein
MYGLGQSKGSTVRIIVVTMGPSEDILRIWDPYFEQMGPFSETKSTDIAGRCGL